MTLLHGGCHCGAVEVSLETALSPDAIELRACQCSFCRRHGAKTMTDPQGSLAISASAESLTRYRFGLRTADYLVCANCGVYVAAVISDGNRKYATLNVAGMQIEGLWDREAKPVHFDGEDQPSRRTRRYKNWTPTHFVASAARRSG